MYFLSDTEGAYCLPMSVTPCTLTIFTWLSFKKRTTVPLRRDDGSFFISHLAVKSINVISQVPGLSSLHVFLHHAHERLFSVMLLPCFALYNGDHRYYAGSCKNFHPTKRQ
jgi:hypothetical protein